MTVPTKSIALCLVPALIILATPAAQSDDTDSHVATIRVVDRQGNPMSAARVFLAVQTPAYAPKRLIDGKLSEDGTFRVPAPDPDLDVREIIVNVGARTFEIGRFELENVDQSKSIEFMMPPREGDRAPDIELADLFSDDTKRLSDYRGQVVFLDFWASWCEPCQEPMAHNQDVMSRRASDWEGKAAIIALSIDDEKDDALNHVESKEWNAMRHFWSAGWRSDAPRTYGIDAIPRGFLIDADGVIHWRGNPRHIDPEELIDRLLKSDPVPPSSASPRTSH
jgi:thiol-disulfide isomerase/thioredoxin